MSLRHARVGRLGEGGLLPAGWKTENVAAFDIVDVNSPGTPWLIIHLTFEPNASVDYVGFSVGSFLPAPNGAALALAGEVTMSECDNIDSAYLIVREWRSGGDFVAQSSLRMEVAETPHHGVVHHRIDSHGRVAQPVFMIKRQVVAPGSATVRLRGLAFGIAEASSDWMRPTRAAG